MGNQLLIFQWQDEKQFDLVFLGSGLISTSLCWNGIIYKNE